MPGPPELVEYCRLFNEEKFFEAHEVLETLWRKTSGAPRDFYHGLIQIAAAFVHLQKGTPEGAKRLLETASGYLAPYPSLYAGIDYPKLLTDAKNCLISKGPFPKL